jgi:hypothetical protein
MGDWKYLDGEVVDAMSSQERARYKREMEIAVFGVGHEVDANGKPIEQGLGSAKQPTKQHFDALAAEAERQASMGRGSSKIIADAVAAALAAGHSQMTPEMIAAAVTAALAGQERTKHGA